MNKKLFVLGLLLILIIGLGGVDGAYAQEQDRVSYIVQVGDTLYSIAQRFGLTMEDLIDANGIADPNQVYVGTVLVLPGVDWVAGQLDVVNVSLGESYLGVRRQYQLDDVTLMRLSGLTSPSQLSVGYPALLPIEQGAYQNAGRIMVGERSLLETAAGNGLNPWVAAAANQLDSPWGVVSGDVLLAPGKSGGGPNGLPSPINSVRVTKGNFVQGKTTVIEIDSDGQTLTLSGELISHPLGFAQKEDGTYLVLQGVHVMTPPGYYPVILSGVLPGGELFQFDQMIEVVAGGYGQESITVDPAFLDPAAGEIEAELIKSFTSQFAPQKMWDQVFSAPTIFGDAITSYFGTRRSFNRSPYDYYHSGTDFGGGAGIEITAPAPGEVVYAGTLEIHGNATIIDHGWGVYTGYWHQAELKVQVGDMVSTGQLIGIVGNTGRSSGAHLHWELWVGGVEVEPLDWLAVYYP